MTYHKMLVERFENHFRQFINDSDVRWNNILVEERKLESVDELRAKGDFDGEIDLGLWNNERDEIYILEIKSDGRKSKASEQLKCAEKYFEDFYDTVITAVYSEQLVPEKDLVLADLVKHGGFFNPNIFFSDKQEILRELREEDYIEKVTSEDLPLVYIDEDIRSYWRLDAMLDNGYFEYHTKDVYELSEEAYEMVDKGNLFRISNNPNKRFK